MKIVVGTTSERKLESVRKLVFEVIKNKKIDIIPFGAQSNVPDTPYDRETYDGAKNRALDCKIKNIDGDYFIGIESGLVQRYDHLYEEVWCCILSKEGQEYFGYSSGLKVPDYLLKKMEEHKLPHSLIFAKLNNHFKKDINSDTWGQYSGNMILRQVGMEEALRNTLIQVFAPENSYYNKKNSN